uniref:Flavin-containing monooxygenase n=1 Tax=Erpetoichthys calabaricus TaxID=27687 RepID=A0A8C4TMD9_ERPCA
MKRRVAVIGAGLSGLTAIKCCLEEGLQPVCFEQSDEIGGLWRFKEEPQDGQASIYQSLTTNTSKEMMCYSDFPFPAHVPNYLHHSKVLEYLHSYARHFDLLRHICFKTLVRSVKKRPDFTRSGQWEVVTVNSEGLEESAIFDGVLVCAGHHTYPHLPLQDFPGIETFEGQYFHSRDYKSPENFRGKRVVIIGIGNSGGDLAVELSRVTEQVFLSTRRGAWILSRIGKHGIPADLQFNTRLNSLLLSILPRGLVSALGEKYGNSWFDHKLYGLQPRHRLMSQHPTVNTDLPSCIITGAVVVKPNVRCLTGSAVVFDDDTVEENIDFVIFATGYNISFPFLPPSVVPVAQNQVSLYKYVFPPELEHPTLAIIGLVQPLGAIMPISELQARWATRVIAGRSKLPSRQHMLQDIKAARERMAHRYVASQRHTVQVDYVTYMDEVAVQIGVRPSIGGLLFRDPKLAMAVFLGPCTPYQYRLSGPGKWAGARDTILTQWKRVIKPLRNREPQKEERPSACSRLLRLSVVAALCAVVTYWVRHEHPSPLQRLMQLLWG